MLKRPSLVLLVVVPVVAGVSYLARQGGGWGEPIWVGILRSLAVSMSVSEAPVVDGALLAINELNEAGAFSTGGSFR